MSATYPIQSLTWWPFTPPPSALTTHYKVTFPILPPISNTFLISLSDDIIGAYADFSQHNKIGVLQAGVKGYRLSTGNFIFSYKTPSYNMMVLTTNYGAQIAAGYVNPSYTTWTDTSTWLPKPYGFFSTSNFTGSKGMCLSAVDNTSSTA